MILDYCKWNENNINQNLINIDVILINSITST